MRICMYKFTIIRNKNSRSANPMLETDWMVVLRRAFLLVDKIRLEKYSLLEADWLVVV